MGQILRRQIPVVNGLQGILDGEVNIEDVVDTLLSNVINVPLSANQGRVLEDKKAERLDVVTDGTSTDVTAPLSATMGEQLKSLLDSKVIRGNIVDSLTSEDGEGSILSANQGRILNEVISARQDGMVYGGIVSLANDAHLPEVEEGGAIYVVSEAGTLNDLTANVGDMIISNGKTYTAPETEGGDKEYPASAWNIIDSSENPDVLRLSNKQVKASDVQKVATAGIAKTLVDLMLTQVKDSKALLVVDRATIVNNKFTLKGHPLDATIVSDMVYAYNPDGTYDEWEGVSIDGREVTLAGAAGVHDGKECKVSYFTNYMAGLRNPESVSFLMMLGVQANIVTRRRVKVEVEESPTIAVPGAVRTVFIHDNASGENIDSAGTQIPVYARGTLIRITDVDSGETSYYEMEDVSFDDITYNFGA